MFFFVIGALQIRDDDDDDPTSMISKRSTIPVPDSL